MTSYLSVSESAFLYFKSANAIHLALIMSSFVLLSTSVVRTINYPPV
jgi:hypothetical protein